MKKIIQTLPQVRIRIIIIKIITQRKVLIIVIYPLMKTMKKIIHYIKRLIHLSLHKKNIIKNMNDGIQ